MNDYEEITLLTEMSRLQKRQQAMAQTQRAIQEAKRQTECWALCKRVLWPIILRHLRSAAKECRSRALYCLSGSDVPGTPFEHSNAHDMQPLRKCIMYYAIHRGFKAEMVSVHGHENGLHIEIQW